MNILGSIISAIVGGLVVAAISYWLFTDRPVLPSLEIRETIVEMPLSAGNSMYETLLKRLEVAGWRRPDQDNLDWFRSDLQRGFSSGVLIQLYKVENLGDRIYKDVTLNSSGFKLAILSDDKTDEVLLDGQAKVFSINPGDAVSVIGLSDGRSYGFGSVGAGRIFVSIGDYPVPIVSSSLSDTGPLSILSEFIVRQPFYTFMLFAIMSATSLFVIIAVCVGVAVRFYPRLAFKLFSDVEYSVWLARLNILQRENIVRFEAIEKLAVKSTRSFRGGEEASPKDPGTAA